MLEIEVMGEPKVRTVNGKNGQFEVTEQRVAVHFQEGYPIEFVTEVDEGSNHAPGKGYQLGRESFQLNQWGQLVFARKLTLVPPKAGQLKAAS